VIHPGRVRALQFAAAVRRSRHAGVTMMAAAFVAACSAAAGTAEGAVNLIWHAETNDGKVLDSREPDRLVNPASVVKLATSFRALDTLGVGHRFETKFSVTGQAGDARDLVVEGGADPDFLFENAVLVAHALAADGRTHFRGDLYMGEKFWIGWERGTVGRETDPVKRRSDMGRRLVSAWSPSGWNAEERQSWAEMAARRGWDAKKPPAIRIDGRVRLDSPPAPRVVLVHRSEPLLTALKRFNVFSNNDIERLDASVGPAAEMSSYLVKKFGKDAEQTSFSTSSGLNRNRMSSRLVVRMLREMKTWLAANGKKPGDLMPVLGCGDSTLTHLFPRLRDSGEANGMAGKTGTLNMQDGGVSALAGYLPAGQGAMFFVAAPGTGPDLSRARAAEEDYVRKLLAKLGPVDPLVCPPAVPTSDAEAEISRPAAG
jgi:D-alanyl-D-alanine carboxypeptidase/D-alanyl-D-alanine-endopeptidase (penicillin-binding protein 4)